MFSFARRAKRAISRINKEQLYSITSELIEQQESIDIILESLPIGILVLDKEHNIIGLNKSARRLLEIKDLIYYNKGCVWEYVRNTGIAILLKNTLNTDRYIKGIEFDKKSNNILSTINISSSSLVQDDKIKGSIILIEDISEKKINQLKLQRAEGLAALTNITAGVAHEIKNPLGAISIHLQLMDKIIQDSNSKEALDSKRHIDIIQEEIERLNSMVIDFLFLVRPSELDKSDLDINALIMGIVDLVRVELEIHRIALSLELEENLPRCFGDEKKIKLALINLIKNSMLALPNGGNITIKTTSCNNNIHISVTDDGTGISSDIINKIFEPYFSTRDSGTGLGLTLVYKVIKDHKGDIKVESVDNNTKFTLTLPLSSKEYKKLTY